MAEEDIRVGLIGAGGNVRNRHIPGFRKVERLQILGVVNRSPESSHRVAEQFDIPRIYHTWQELLDDDAINAVCIGTWPYMHRTLTLAALEKGKHVLTEARMASTAQEARGHAGGVAEPTALSVSVDSNFHNLQDRQSPATVHLLKGSLVNCCPSRYRRSKTASSIGVAICTGATTGS